MHCKIRIFKMGSLYLRLGKIFAILLVVFYVAFFCNDERYWLMWSLPLTYLLILTLINRFSDIKSDEFGYKIIKTMMFIRYVCTPLAIVISDHYSGYGFEPTKSTITFSIILMCYEIIAIGIAILIYNKKNHIKNIARLNLEIKAENIFGYGIYILFAIFILILSGIDIIIPSNFLIITNEIENIEINNSFSNVIFILRNSFRVIIGIFLLNFIKVRNINENTKYYISLISMILIVSLYTSTNRWDLLCLPIVAIFILSDLYPNYKKFTIIIFIIIMLMALTSATIYKFWSYTSSIVLTDRTILSEIFNIVLSQFQSYFSGPRNVGLAIDMSSELNVNISWLINDIFGSLPFFSRLFNQNIRFNLLYNQYIYSGDIIAQIIPMIGIGYNVFGFIFAPIVTVFFELVILKLNDIHKKSLNIADRYLLIYMMTYTSLCMGLNIQIITNKYYALFLPCILIIIFNRTLSKILVYMGQEKAFD